MATPSAWKGRFLAELFRSRDPIVRGAKITEQGRSPFRPGHEGLTSFGAKFLKTSAASRREIHIYFNWSIYYRLSHIRIHNHININWRMGSRACCFRMAGIDVLHVRQFEN